MGGAAAVVLTEDSEPLQPTIAIPRNVRMPIREFIRHFSMKKPARTTKRALNNVNRTAYCGVCGVAPPGFVGDGGWLESALTVDALLTPALVSSLPPPLQPSMNEPRTERISAKRSAFFMVRILLD